MADKKDKNNRKERLDRPKFPLSNKIALLVMILVVLVSFILFLTTVLFLSGRMNEIYGMVAENIAGRTGTIVEDEDVASWATLEEPTDEYVEIQKKISDVYDDFNEWHIDHIRIALPEGSGLRYVMNVNEQGSSGLYNEYIDIDGSAYMAYAAEIARLDPVGPIIYYLEGVKTLNLLFPVKVGPGDSIFKCYIEVQLSMLEESIWQRENLMRYLTGTILIALLFSLLPIIVTSRGVGRPLRRLTRAAARMTAEKKKNGNTETDIFSKMKIRSSDEVGVLYRSLSQMEQDMNTYTRDLVTITAEKERVASELDTAADIQLGQLPRNFDEFSERSEFDIYASMKPARFVGGDFYDFFMIDDDHIALEIADVSDKGVPAALFMMISKLLIKNRLLAGESPSRALEEANNQLTKNNEMNQFVTVWLAVVDLRTGEGVAVNAGHEHPALCHKGGMYEFVEYRHSMPVASFEGLKFAEHGFKLESGDSIFVYTDGVTEARSADGELFGMERTLEMINKDPAASPEKLLEIASATLDEFSEGAEQADDITMLCFRYYG